MLSAQEFWPVIKVDYEIGHIIVMRIPIYLLLRKEKKGKGLKYLDVALKVVWDRKA